MTVGKSQTLAEFLGSSDDPVAYEPPRDVKSFCRGILSSREYRASLLDRITLGTLSPAIECRLYDYAYGKPIERFEVKDTSDPLDDLSAAQLEDRALRLLEVARQLRSDQPHDAEAGESVH